MEGDEAEAAAPTRSKISIHALRVEGDCCRNNLGVLARYFYPRPPGGGRRRHDPRGSAQGERFLSTPSGWRATRRAPRLPGITCVISIHALRVEGDINTAFDATQSVKFLSTPSGWRATPTRTATVFRTRISIHALRVEGDIDNMFNTYKTNTFLSTPSGWRATSSISPAHFRGRDFYPRPPGGGRRSGAERRGRRIIFLSTPSGWRATREGKNGDGTEEISIHALRVEGDLTLLITGRGVEYFYPRPPGGGRLQKRKIFSSVLAQK